LEQRNQAAPNDWPESTPSDGPDSELQGHGPLEGGDSEPGSLPVRRPPDPELPWGASGPKSPSMVGRHCAERDLMREAAGPGRAGPWASN
jgi:hypothetical protein